MADIRTHFEPGPSATMPSPEIVATPSYEVAEGGLGGVSGEDVELIGRPAAGSAPEPERDRLAVASVENTAWEVSGHGAAPAATAWSEPGVDIVDDAPHWSFRSPTPSLVAEQPSSEAADQPELPFAAPNPPAASPPRPIPMFGPVGQLRSALAVPLLAVATLGLYALVWHQRTNRELELFDPKLHSRPRRSTFAVLIPWIVGLAVSLAGAAALVTARLGVGLPSGLHVTTVQAYALLAGLVAVPYLTLLVPFSLVAVVMTLERLRSVEEHVGTTTDRQVRPVAVSLLLGIPVLGGLVLLAIEQRRLNAIWQSVTPSGRLYH